MHQSKIIELLKQLDARTLTRFKDYSTSPYFNKHQATQQLCLHLLKQAPDFSNTRKLDKHYIYALIFSKEPFDNKKFHRLSSQALQLLYDFLVDDAFQQQTHKRTILLLETLRKYQLKKHYLAIEKRYRRLEHQQSINSNDFYEHQFKFYKELDTAFIAQGGRSYNPNLQLANEALDHLFILEKLKMACDMANRNRVIQANYEWSITESIQEYLSIFSDQVPPIIQIYHTIFNMLTSPITAASHYIQLKKLLHQHTDLLTKDDRLQTYGYALNYAIGEINQQGAFYLKEALEIYLHLVESGAILIGGFLMPQEYKNIVTLAVRLKRYEWAENFIEQYQHQLPTAIRQNAYTYNLAALFHSKGALNKALEILHNVDFVNPTYYLGTKIIQLKIYYALAETEALYSLIDACKSYLHRNKQLATYQKQSTHNFMHFTKKLFKIKEQIGYHSPTALLKSLSKLNQTIVSCSSVANKDWLLETIGDLQQDLTIKR